MPMIMPRHANSGLKNSKCVVHLDYNALLVKYLEFIVLP